MRKIERLTIQKLRSDDKEEREKAQEELRELWHQEKGASGLFIALNSLKLIIAGEFEEAIEVLSKGIKRYPDFSELWDLRGRAYIKVRNYPAALNDFRVAVILKPARYEVWAKIGAIEAGKGNYLAAIKALDRYLEIYPINLDAQHYRLELVVKMQQSK